MVRNAWLIEAEPWFRLTDRGTKALGEFGITPSVGRTCMDWSERRLHLAGPLGSQLAQYLLTRRLVLRARQGRALQITTEGWEVITACFCDLKMTV